MSDYLEEAMQKAINDLAQQVKDEALAMRPTLVGDLHYLIDPNYNPYAPFHEFNRASEPSNVIDSTATVIDESVKALPAAVQKKE